MINSQYLSSEVLNNITSYLKKSSSIQLQEILTQEIYQKLLNNLSKLKLKREYIPNSHSYSSLEFKDNELISLLTEFISKLLNKKVKLISSKLYSFAHKDYTLLQDDISEEKGITAILELTPDWNLESNGYTSFMIKDEELIRINPSHNTLSIIKTTKRGF